jgi:hypothetical protein
MLASFAKHQGIASNLSSSANRSSSCWSFASRVFISPLAGGFRGDVGGVAGYPDDKDKTCGFHFYSNNFTPL